MHMGQGLAKSDLQAASRDLSMSTAGASQSSLPANSKRSLMRQLPTVTEGRRFHFLSRKRSSSSTVAAAGAAIVTSPAAAAAESASPTDEPSTQLLIKFLKDNQLQDISGIMLAAGIRNPEELVRLTPLAVDGHVTVQGLLNYVVNGDRARRTAAGVPNPFNCADTDHMEALPS